MEWFLLDDTASMSQNEGEHKLVSFHTIQEKTVKSITFLGVDLAKNVFQLHGVDELGRTQLNVA